MIVPRSRLLIWVGIVVVPFATVGTMVPSAVIPSIVIIGGFLILVSVDAVGARSALDGIGMEFPEVMRMTKDREGVFDVYIRNEKMKAKKVRIGMAFPREIVTERETMFLELQEGSSLSHFYWRCKPLRRGRYLFDSSHMESFSYLGFWAKRAAARAQLEIRVYPDLLFERKNLAALFLSRGTFGIHSQRQIGQGRDFERLREYIHGDSYEHIHWKATAKHAHPITKVFQIERTQEVYVFIDASRLSGRSIMTPEKKSIKDDKKMYPETILERFIMAALVMGVAAKRQNDLFGVVSFSDRVHRFIRAKSGREHYNSCREALYELQSHIVTPDFEELSAFIGLKLRRRALLIFLTNLDDPVLSESFIRNMDLISRKHLIIVNMIKPRGIQPIFTDPHVKSLDDIYQHLGSHMLWHNFREIERTLKRKGIQFSLASNETMCSHLVSQYMSIKQRQLI
jgi:uncharacterized protein (DUF58 family)